MNIAAYCRVSTDKEDQLNSLEAQKKFFSEYTQRTGDVLVRLYADEGISGTKIKNRRRVDIPKKFGVTGQGRPVYAGSGGAGIARRMLYERDHHRKAGP